MMSEDQKKTSFESVVSCARSGPEFLLFCYSNVCVSINFRWKGLCFVASLLSGYGVLRLVLAIQKTGVVSIFFSLFLLNCIYPIYTILLYTEHTRRRRRRRLHIPSYRCVCVCVCVVWKR